MTAGGNNVMKLKRIASAFLALFLLAGPPVGTTSDAADRKTPTPEPTMEHETKISSKIIRKPPFVITIDDSNVYDLSESGMTASSNSYLVLMGQCNDSTLEGDWTFSFRFTETFGAETNPIAGLVGGIGMGIEATGIGTGTSVMKGPEKKKKEKPTPTPTPDDSRLPLAPLVPEGPPVTGNTKFDVQVPVQIRNIRGGDTISGTISTPDGSQWTTAHVNLFDESSAAQKVAVNVEINVFEDDRVRATLVIDGKTRYFDGLLTSQQELQVKRKETYKWPIWGVWTDVNPYSPIPDVARDLESLKKNPDKSISYPSGRWLSMDPGKKDQAGRYSIVESDGERVLFETGEIWSYPGSALFVPDAWKVLSSDMKTVLKETVPPGYPKSLTYQNATDTLLDPEKGRYVRVRTAILLGTWSDAGDFSIPPKGGKSDVPDGIWYEFTRAPEDDAADRTITGYSGLYQFKRSTVKGGEVTRTDEGIALSMPIAGADMIRLEDITSKDGRGTEKTLEPEMLLVEQFDKDAGTVVLNGKPFTNVSGPSPAGRWCLADKTTNPPDIAHGTFKVRDQAGDLFAPKAGDQWLELDGKTKTFTWTQIVAEPAGILVETGKFRTLGGNALILSEMKASYWPDLDAESEGAAFENRLNGLGERMLTFSRDKEGTQLDLGGIGQFRNFTMIVNKI